MRRYRRMAAVGALALAVFASTAAAGIVNLGGTGADPGTNCSGLIAINNQVASGNPSIVPAGEWTLTRWSLTGGSGGTVGLRILRPTGIAHQYTIVAATKTKSLTPGVMNTFTASISVRGGDVIGLYAETPTDCARFTGDPNDQYLIFDPSTPVGGIANAISAGSGYRLNLAAVLDSGAALIPYAGYCSAPGNTWADGTAITTRGRRPRSMSRGRAVRAIRPLPGIPSRDMRATTSSFPTVSTRTTHRPVSRRG